MSMRDYGVDDYGVVLNGLGDENGKHPEFDEEWLEEMVDSDLIDVQGNFTGELIPVFDTGSPDWNQSEYLDCESVYYIALKRQPELFKRAYKDMNDLMDEVVESYRTARREDDRLPSLTRDELRSMLRYITGSYNG